MIWVHSSKPASLTFAASSSASANSGWNCFRKWVGTIKLKPCEADRNAVNSPYAAAKRKRTVCSSILSTTTGSPATVSHDQGRGVISVFMRMFLYHQTKSSAENSSPSDQRVPGRR